MVYLMLVSANRWLRGINTYRFPWYLMLVSANRWLRGINTYRFPWYLTLVSANHASSNPGLVINNGTSLLSSKT